MIHLVHLVILEQEAKKVIKLKMGNSIKPQIEGASKTGTCNISNSKLEEVWQFFSCCFLFVQNHWYNIADNQRTYLV